MSARQTATRPPAPRSFTVTDQPDWSEQRLYHVARLVALRPHNDEVTTLARQQLPAAEGGECPFQCHHPERLHRSEVSAPNLRGELCYVAFTECVLTVPGDCLGAAGVALSSPMTMLAAVPVLYGYT